MWVDHDLGTRWQYSEKVRDHFPNRARLTVQLPRTRARPKAIKWQRQRMLIALDDMEAREPFLKEVMAWRDANADTLQGLISTNTVEAMEAHWRMIKEGLFPIAYSFFAVNGQSPRKPWATDEFVNLSNEKKAAMQALDDHCIKWTSLARASADVSVRAETSPSPLACQRGLVRQSRDQS